MTTKFLYCMLFIVLYVYTGKYSMCMCNTCNRNMINMCTQAYLFFGSTEDEILYSQLQLSLNLELTIVLSYPGYISNSTPPYYFAQLKLLGLTTFVTMGHRYLPRTIKR